MKFIWNYLSAIIAITSLILTTPAYSITEYEIFKKLESAILKQNSSEFSKIAYKHSDKIEFLDGLIKAGAMKEEMIDTVVLDHRILEIVQFRIKQIEQSQK